MTEPPPPRKLTFMFLGGPLDHARRYIVVDGPLMTPPAQYQCAVTAQSWSPAYDELAAVNTPRLIYNRVRATDGLRTWWCYVLDGYTPSINSLLDANPHPF